MSDLVDIFTQNNKKTKNDSFDKTFVKNSNKSEPSLFDTILKSSKEELESKENKTSFIEKNLDKDLNKAYLNIEINKEDKLPEETFSQDKGIVKEDEKYKENKTSLLDRLILDIKSSEDFKNVVISNETQNSETKEKFELTEEKKQNFESLLLDEDSSEENNITLIQDSEASSKDNLENEASKSTLSTIENNLDLDGSIVEHKLVKDSQEQIIRDEVHFLKEKDVLDINTNKFTKQSEEKELSLMDKLILMNTKDETNEILDDNIKTEQNVNDKLNSKIFLADQKNILNKQLLFNKEEAINILNNASSLEAVKKSAEILDLEASDLSLEQEFGSELKDIISERDRLNKKASLNALLAEKDIRSADIKNLITSSVEASKALMTDTLNIQNDAFVDVQPNLLNSIQTRIIGAKQQLSAMMSDIARQMYENYKPPLTVFRINLNPANLGSIAILMKQERGNGININMSVSNLTTLDLLMENQNLLRSSLLKTFNDTSNFNLDFSSGSENPNENFSSNQEKDASRDTNTEAVLKLKEENSDFEEQNDYM